MDKRLINEIEKIIPSERITYNAPLSKYTTFHIGGSAAVIVEPKSSEEIKRLVALFASCGTGYYVLGNGSNVLAADEGLDAPVIRIGKSMSEITVFGDCVTAQAGAMLSALASRAAEASLRGLEFASGIPGTVGGGTVINAGAYGGELKDVIEAVSFVGPDANEYVVSNEEMEFGYRKSALLDTDCIVTGVSFALRHANKDEIVAKMRELNSRRREKQPLEYPSAGSTFKRPVSGYAAALIEGAGLKGKSVGGAAVSEKHAGFIINKGGATASDVLALMDNVQKTVLEKDGIMLEPEIRIWGNNK